MLQFYACLQLAFLPVQATIVSSQGGLLNDTLFPKTLFAEEPDKEQDEIYEFWFLKAFSLFCSVVLMNILGAMLTNHHDDLQSKSELEWKRLRTLMVRTLMGHFLFVCAFNYAWCWYPLYCW